MAERGNVCQSHGSICLDVSWKPTSYDVKHQWQKKRYISDELNWPCHFIAMYRMTAKSKNFFFPQTFFFFFLFSFKMLPILEFVPLTFTLPCLYSCLGGFLVSAHRSGNGSPSEESLPAILVCPQEHTATYSRAFPLKFFFQPFDAK